MESLRDELWNKQAELLVAIDHELKQKKAFYALVRFCEDLQRLTWRYSDYRGEGARNYKRAQRNKRKMKDLDECQKKMVDKSMAFHQQAYVIVGSLGALLNQLKDVRASPYTSGEGAASTTAILTELETRHFHHDETLLTDLGHVKNSAWFRSKYVDHPQQHQPHCWLTYFNFDVSREYIIFYNPIASEPFEMPPVEDIPLHRMIDTDDPQFSVRVGHARWFVAPDPQATYKSLERVSRHAINACREPLPHLL
jgi:hypothetical protein